MKKLKMTFEEAELLYDSELRPLMQELLFKYPAYHEGMDCPAKDFFACLLNDIEFEKKAMKKKKRLKK